MNREWQFFVGISLSGVVLASAISTVAQQKQAPPERIMVERERVLQGPEGPEGPLPPPGDTFVFVASEIGFDGKPVKGAPYSAQAVTESTQTLGDGNRIINKSTATLYRDVEGRTRREQTLRAFGPFAGGEPAPTIFISDPVAGVSYTLDPRTHVARKMPAFHFELAPPMPADRPGAESAGAGVVVERAPLPPPPAGPMVRQERDVFMLRTPPGAVGQAQFVFKREGAGRIEDNVVTEKLGTQIIEGVSAEGTRDTITIPAGQIGNERPIEIVSERWYSPELQTVVMTRHSDPRFGENIYRLTNINRNEPAHSLFEVSSDYTVKEETPTTMRTKKLAPIQ